jgi:hypothetical protein
MSHKNFFSFLLPVLAALLFGAPDALACSCGPRPTVLDSYERSDAVVIVRALSIEKAEKGKEQRAGAQDVISTRVVVEKVFKGKLKPGDEMIFGQGGGADCIWTFDEQSIDRQFLFYLSAPEPNRKLWFGFGCGRSIVLEYAADDLLYLNNLEKARGRSRISGTLVVDDDSGISGAGRTVRIIGASKTYTVKTDADGVYEIYDLPGGKYLIEPEVPSGWKMDKFWHSHSPNFAGEKEEVDKELKRVPIILQERRHATFNIHLKIENALRGRVYDTRGNPMPSVCLKAEPPEAEKTKGYYTDCTDEDGNFAIKDIARGSYVLVVNDDGKISSSEPFRTFYYPNVFERDRAAVFTIGPGDKVEGLNIYVPQMEETIRIEGVVLYSDGKPVVDEGVHFEQEKDEDNLESMARAKTDARGRFSITLLKGWKGILYGMMYTFTGEYENCPKLESLIKKQEGRTFAEMRTPAVEVRAENDLQGVELKYPFPGCKKAKLPED